MNDSVCLMYGVYVRMLWYQLVREGAQRGFSELIV